MTAMSTAYRDFLIIPTTDLLAMSTYVTDDAIFYMQKQAMDKTVQ